MVSPLHPSTSPLPGCPVLEERPQRAPRLDPSPPLARRLRTERARILAALERFETELAREIERARELRERFASLRETAQRLRTESARLHQDLATLRARLPE